MGGKKYSHQNNMGMISKNLQLGGFDDYQMVAMGDAYSHTIGGIGVHPGVTSPLNHGTVGPKPIEIIDQQIQGPANCYNN